MKKYLSLALCALMLLPLFACGKKGGADLKVGMLTDSSPLADFSHNEAAWNGISAASVKYGISAMSSVPAEATLDAYLASVKELYDAGCRIIIAPTYTLSEVVSKARSTYKDCEFVCIGFTPKSLPSNVAAYTFAVHESAFVAGVAAALTLKSGAFGAVFGMDLDSSRRYAGGFTAGISYANLNYGTAVTFEPDNIVYAGSYNDYELGLSLTETLFKNGVKCVFTDGGKTADGVIEKTKIYRGAGNDVWVIGSEVNSYNSGIYEGARSVVLTSAVNRVASAIRHAISAHIKGAFPGGKCIELNGAQDGTGIPAGEINLSKETAEICVEITALIADGTITVPDDAALYN